MCHSTVERKANMQASGGVMVMGDGAGKLSAVVADFAMS